jgi:hypothetical protein
MPTGKVKFYDEERASASSVLMMARRSSFMPLGSFPLAPRSRPEPELTRNRRRQGPRPSRCVCSKHPGARQLFQPADDMSIIVETW